MKDEIKNIIADNAEVVLDSLLENKLLKEIPVLGTSLNIFKAVQSIRDTAYLNKVKVFIEKIGEVSDEQRQRLISESKKDRSKRAKFGDALFTTIEQSDSRAKVEYLAVAFEAFLNEDFGQDDLRLICHTIHSSFTDDLADVIENERPQLDLKYMVPTGLAEAIYQQPTYDMKSNEPNYELSNVALMLKKAWVKYGK